MPRYFPADLVVLWGVRNENAIQRQRANGGETCILERGYVGDRFSWTSVSFGGGLNGHGRFYGPFDDASRWGANFRLQEWQKRDGYVLIMGQVPTDMSLRGLDPFGLWQEAANTFKEAGHDVRFRPHPLAPPGPIPAPVIGGSLDEAIAGASFVVTINSNSGVDAVVAGTPTITLDTRAMSWSVTGHKLKRPPTPDRAKWASRLAWCQYTTAEMETGFCWENVKHAMD